MLELAVCIQRVKEIRSGSKTLIGMRGLRHWNELGMLRQFRVYRGMSIGGPGFDRCMNAVYSTIPALDQSQVRVELLLLFLLASIVLMLKSLTCEDVVLKISINLMYLYDVH